jgi:hypothetical protein
LLLGGLGLGADVLAVQQLAQQPLGDLGIPAVARVTSVAVMSSASGSTATWAL